MQILVTGGAGFIGSAYVRMLLDGRLPGAEHARVTVLDLLTYAGNTDNLPLSHPRLTFVRGDVCDLPLLLRLLPGHDAVLHFAAESHVDRSIEGAGDFVRTNVQGTQTLLDACLRTGTGPVVLISTDEVYGSIAEGSWTEDAPLAPNSPYAASKAAADLIALSYWRTHGLDVRITRCSNNYGPHQHPEKLIPRFTTRLLSGESVPLYGTGANVREWLHVEDHCRAVQLALTGAAAGSVHHVGGGRALSNAALTDRLLELTGAPDSLVTYVTDRKGHDQRYALDDTRIREELGYVPRIPFEEGLAATVSWYRDHPQWWKQRT
ncbi:dTDP-glucose 4,6-dehydratase [Streptomyces sp. NPDC058657]|uniref:dTDP-glucose 4,6-dehydratase n=1 Tax=unclassified Streptomyces TaxID=2593676 RepID=UPI0036485343